MEYANYIRRCIEIARRGEYFVAPNPMVGAVLVGPNPDRVLRTATGCPIGQSPSPVKGREVVLAEGWHERYGAAHAEVNCFRNYEETITNHQSPITNLKDCTLFVSLEPCSHYGKTPPCAKLIIEKGVGRVVVGMLDPNPLVAGRGVQMLRDAGIEVVVGVEEEACRQLNKRFLCLHEQHRPYVVLKWAQTADGFVDRKRVTGYGLRVTGDGLRVTGDGLRVTGYGVQGTGEHLNGALAISTPETKRLVHRMRAENMAIMVGTRTVLLDNPRLMTTHWEGRNPIRVTLDRHGVIPPDARIFSDDTERTWALDGPSTIVYRERTDWPFILSDLASRGIHSILVEGGPTLLRTIFDSGIWDEAHIEVAPELTIGTGVPAPQVPLPEQYDTVDGHRLYTIYK